MLLLFYSPRPVGEEGLGNLRAKSFQTCILVVSLLPKRALDKLWDKCNSLCLSPTSCPLYLSAIGFRLIKNCSSRQISQIKAFQPEPKTISLSNQAKVLAAPDLLLQLYLPLCLWDDKRQWNCNASFKLCHVDLVNTMYVTIPRAILDRIQSRNSIFRHHNMLASFFLLFFI